VNYLIDTNIISEVRKGDQCNRNVAAWYASVDDAEIYLSERARSRDPMRARALERWLSTLRDSFSDRVLPVDQLVAEEWGRMSAQRSVPSIDGLLAATAKVHRMTLATRNLSDVAGLGAQRIQSIRAIELKPGDQRIGALNRDL
jgi:predicted nucleic acid-binding protein